MRDVLGHEQTAIMGAALHHRLLKGGELAGVIGVVVSHGLSVISGSHFVLKIKTLRVKIMLLKIQMAAPLKNIVTFFRLFQSHLFLRHGHTTQNRGVSSRN